MGSSTGGCLAVYRDDLESRSVPSSTKDLDSILASHRALAWKKRGQAVGEGTGFSLIRLGPVEMIPLYSGPAENQRTASGPRTKILVDYFGLRAENIVLGRCLAGADIERV